MSVDVELITDAFIALIRTGTLGKPVGDQGVPPSGGYPYSAVHWIPGGEEWGAPLVDPCRNGDFVFQVDSVSLDPKTTRRHRDTVRRTVLARTGSAFQVPITSPAGWTIADREPDGPPGGVFPSGDPSKGTRVYTSSERFRLRVVAA